MLGRFGIRAALFIAGGASNWIDRVIAGKVVDFIVVGVGSLARVSHAAIAQAEA